MAIVAHTRTSWRKPQRDDGHTQGRIKVSVLGVPAYRQSFDRVERWDGPRLVSFHSVTTENGKRTSERRRRGRSLHRQHA